jgi:uncharacterized membrane protein
MAEHTTVVVIGSFAESGGAEAALRQVRQELNHGVHDAAYVVKTEEGKLQVTDTGDWGWGKGALWGGLAGGLVALIVPPVGLGMAAVGGIIGATGAAARDAGISNLTLKALGETLSAGSSAVVLAVEPANAALAESALTQAGAATVREGFSQEVVAALRAIEDAPTERTDQALAQNLNTIGRAM